jgi:glycine oxidase
MAASPEPILILGGGLMGLAIAHQLARRGRAVVLLSRRRSEAAGFVAAGMLAPHAEGLSGALLQLGQASLGRVPAWVDQIEADSGLSCGLHFLELCCDTVQLAGADDCSNNPAEVAGSRQANDEGEDVDAGGLGGLVEAELHGEQAG